MIGTRERAREATRFDALLRNMLSFGLVQPEPGGGWRLSPEAQARLDFLGAPPAVHGELLYIGHRCTVCHEHRPTRRRDGGYVCERCSALAAEASNL